MASDSYIVLEVWDLAFGVPGFVTWHLGCGTQWMAQHA